MANYLAPHDGSFIHTHGDYTYNSPLAVANGHTLSEYAKGDEHSHRASTGTVTAAWRQLCQSVTTAAAADVVEQALRCTTTAVIHRNRSLVSTAST